jgi:hypothetical protein
MHAFFSSAGDGCGEQGSSRRRESSPFQFRTRLSAAAVSRHHASRARFTVVLRRKIRFSRAIAVRGLAWRPNSLRQGRRREVVRGSVSTSPGSSEQGGSVTLGLGTATAERCTQGRRCVLIVRCRPAPAFRAHAPYRPAAANSVVAAQPGRVTAAAASRNRCHETACGPFAADETLGLDCLRADRAATQFDAEKSYRDRGITADDWLLDNPMTAVFSASVLHPAQRIGLDRQRANVCPDLSRGCIPDESRQRTSHAGTGGCDYLKPLSDKRVV